MRLQCDLNKRVISDLQGEMLDLQTKVEQYKSDIIQVRISEFILVLPYEELRTNRLTDRTRFRSNEKRNVVQTRNNRAL